MNTFKYSQYIRGIKLSGVLKKCTIDIKTGDSLKRKKISGFSESSAKRLSWYYMQYEWKSMITLTYHNNFPQWEECKSQLDNFLRVLRRMGIKYLWVVEFQKRGYPHYHVWMDRRFKDCSEKEDNYKKNVSWRPIMKAWLRVTNQLGDPQAIAFSMHQRSYTHWTISANINYARKYASKNQQKGLPSGIDFFGRWWGCSSGLQLERDGYTVDMDDCTTLKTNTD